MHQTVRLNLVRLHVLRMLALALMLLWGSPILASFAWSQETSEHAKPEQDQKQSATFTGTVARNGSQFVLHDASGATYLLDDSERAKTFEGKAVRVTGQLDEQSKMIHVETIEAASA